MLNIYQLEQRIQHVTEAQRVVGMALVMIQNAEVIYARGFGVTSSEDGGVPVTPHTLFCIGSISKTLTATLVMRLVEQDRLDLDTPVITYMPGFIFSNAERGKAVTLRHILSHTSGLPSAGKDFGPRDPDALRRFVWDELPRYAFVADPGEVHLYSNTAFVLAGHLAEVVTGKYYDQLVHELIFEPLHMRRSTFDRAVAMTYPLALAHEAGAGDRARTKHRFTDNVSGNPAGFGISSALDLANFAIMHLNHGQFQHTRVLSPESIALMQTSHANRYTGDAESGYGLGLYTGEYKGVRQVGHGGMLESYNCYLHLFPDRGVGVVLLCNYDPDDFTFGLIRDMHDQLLDLPANYAASVITEPNRAMWSRHMGTYLSLQSGLAHVKIVDDQLVLEREGMDTLLAAVEGGLYLANGAPVGFVPDVDGPTQYMVIHGEPYCRYELDPSFVPDPAAWTSYEGTYVEWVIDPDPIRIRIADGELFLQWWGDEVKCMPLSNASFTSARGVIEFELAEDGSEPVLITGKAARRYRVSGNP